MLLIKPEQVFPDATQMGKFNNNKKNENNVD